MHPDGAGHTTRILLVDCDAFYVQVARLEDPQGAGKAKLLVVGGSPTGRGVVTSASYAAREYGVRSAMPTAKALRLCPNATVVDVPRGACSRRSKEIGGTLRDLSPVVQAASIDEFYLDLTGTDRLMGETLEESATRIRSTVLKKTNISVSIGGSTRKMVAKLASSVAKPGGVHIVAPGQEAAFMRRLDLADIPGVGPALVDSLKRRGLVRIESALEVELEWLQKWFGEHRALWLHRRMRGLDSDRVDPREPRKSISSERTFFSDLDTSEELEDVMMKLSVSVGRTMRRSGLRARTITVKLRDGDFTTRSRGRTVPEAVETDAAVFAVARELLGELRSRRRTPSRLLGVGLTNFVAGIDPAQLGLFEDGDRIEGERERALGKAVDGLRDRFGDGAVVPGRIMST
jgi:DNA polymerase-4